MKKPSYLLLVAFMLFVQTGWTQTQKVLFDARRAQMAGDADWIIDADLFNLGRNASGVMVTGAGNESNPQRIPTPAQSGITSSTAETYWKGGLSYWAVDLVRRGYVVETLPYNGSLTYGNSTNPQDLANYKVFIVIEPNIRFTAAEKTALLTFVQQGGGLFIGGNHNGSDRNSDGYDSRAVWNDFFTNNGVISNPFGISFDAASFSQTSTNLASLSGNPVLSGPAGTVTGLQYNSGTSMTINRSSNPNVTALIYKTGASKTGTTQVMFATSRYGNGKVCAIGDSSPSDDGTGDTNDALYSSYGTAASGSHRKLFQNAVLWLSSSTPEPPVQFNEEDASADASSRFGAIDGSVLLYPNPAQDIVYVNRPAEEPGVLSVRLFDLTGKILADVAFPESEQRIGINLKDLTPGAGVFLVRILGVNRNWSLRLVRN